MIRTEESARKQGTTTQHTYTLPVITLQVLLRQKIRPHVHPSQRIKAARSHQYRKLSRPHFHGVVAFLEVPEPQSDFGEHQLVAQRAGIPIIYLFMHIVCMLFVFALID
jgi:hypothetical protein